MIKFQSTLTVIVAINNPQLLVKKAILLSTFWSQTALACDPLHISRESRWARGILNPLVNFDTSATVLALSQVDQFKILFAAKMFTEARRSFTYHFQCGS
jgi:hypothetical protein